MIHGMTIQDLHNEFQIHNSHLSGLCDDYRGEPLAFRLDVDELTFLVVGHNATHAFYLAESEGKLMRYSVMVGYPESAKVDDISAFRDTAYLGHG